MTQDWNGIDAIAYNHLNLPTRINFKVDQGEKFISYIYNALGQKVSKQVVHQSPTEQVNTLTEYLSGYQYVGGILQLFPTAEGYVSVTNGKDFDYVYNYTDHIGNVRLSYTMPKGSTVLSILEENHYYPFGMKHANYGDDKHDYVRNPDGTGYAVIDQVHKNKYQYKYNGKEFQDELSLNWYDYHARNYDPSIGRWMNIDPLAEVSKRWSPYNYCMNNPVYFIDPDGMASVGLSSNERAMFGMGPRPGTTKSTSEQQDDAAAASMERAVANGSNASGETDPPKPGTGTSTGYMETSTAKGVPTGNKIMIQLDEVTVVSSNKRSNSTGSDNSFGCLFPFKFPSFSHGFTIWGEDKSGSTDGQKGTTTDSFESSEIPGIGISNSGSNGFNKKGSLFLRHLEGMDDAGDFTGRIDPIVEGAKSDPIVVQSIIVKQYTYNLNDSTITPSVNNVNFRGYPSDVKRQVDSTIRRNNARESDKKAWITHWGR